MAKIVLNPLIDGIQGRVGNVVFRRTSTGKTTLSACPIKSTKKASEAQLAHRARFREAAAYAKAAMADPTARAHYEEQAMRLQSQPYPLAFADYFKGTNLLEK